MTLLALPGRPADVPIGIGADPARELARRELARAVYQEQRPPVIQRVVGWLGERLVDLLRLVTGISPGGSKGLLVLVAVVVVVAIVVRWRLGRTARSAASRSAVLDAVVRTADDHRRAADRHAGAGEYDEAVRERMRGLVRGLEERTLLESRRGRTAGEAAREAGRVLPAVAGPLAEAARRFDETVYGGRPADAAADARMRAVDDEVRATRAVPAVPSDAPTRAPAGTP